MKNLKDIPKKEQSIQICEKYISKDVTNIRYASAKFLTYELCFNVVKNEGLLLQYIPKKHKQAELCLEAINNNIKAFEYVPDENKTTLLKNHMELCDAVIEENALWLKYVPEEYCTVDLCIRALEKNIKSSIHIPLSLKTDRQVIAFEKKMGVLSVIDMTYRESDCKFVVKAYLADYGDVDVEFEDFKEFYEYVDGDLSGAVLYGYDFNNEDLSEYNITNAFISGKVLQKYGLHNNDFYKTNILSQIESTYKEIIINEENNNIIPFDKKEELVNYRNHRRFFEFEHRETRVYYISDLHLTHHIYRQLGMYASENEVRWYIKKLVKQLRDVPDWNLRDYLLIAGDISSSLKISKMFFEELTAHWFTGHIVVVPGNHELLDPFISCMDDINAYREMFKKLKIHFLQNDLLIVSEEKTKKFSEEKIEKMNEEELREAVQKSYFTILGGLGFSGYNKVYNGTSLQYGKVIKTLEEDLFQTQRFEKMYKKIKNAISESQIIVLTHTPKSNWSKDDYNKNWIYVNGHTHQNICEVSGEKIYYADNQIGYKNDSMRLKFFSCTALYDYFIYYADGIYKITNEEYYWFNRGKGISTTCNKPDIYMVKSQGIYAFFTYMRDQLYILNGGKENRLDKNSLSDLKYYYENLSLYADKINCLMKKYSSSQKEISEFVKHIGGSGFIHGCIVDIDYFNHIYINPYDGTVTPYFAFDIIQKYTYPDLPTLLQAEIPELFMNYSRLLNGKENGIIPVTCYPKEFNQEAHLYENTDVYRVSRIVRSLQYTLKKNVVRKWNSKLLEYDFDINDVNEKFLLSLK